jgi:hypothetical protein
MTDWTLTTASPSTGARVRRGTAPNVEQARQRLLDAVRRHLGHGPLPARFRLHIDGDVFADMASGEDEHGRPEAEGLLSILDRIADSLRSDAGHNPGGDHDPNTH